MSHTKVIDIIRRARNSLHDISEDRWSNEELLEWFNAAQTAIVSIRPDAYTQEIEYLCSQRTRQVLPAGAIRLFRVDRNVDGLAISMIDRGLLDVQVPDWHNATSPATSVDHYVYDDREPTVFYLYPVPVAGHRVALVHSVAPPKVSITNFAGDTATISIDDTYSDPLLDYILFRAFAKDAEFVDSAARSATHRNAFFDAIAGKNQSDAGVTPTNG